jgi:hypothetical protein
MALIAVRPPDATEDVILKLVSGRRAMADLQALSLNEELWLFVSPASRELLVDARDFQHPHLARLPNNRHEAHEWVKKLTGRKALQKSAG